MLTQSVEVTFDAGNSHRRKSSLVSSEAAAARVQRASRRDQCIVHQFLESQRRAKGASGIANGHDSCAHSSNPSPNRAQHTSDRCAADSPAASHGQESQPQQCRASLDPTSLEAARVGQADQQAWMRQMTGNVSDPDLATQYDVVHSRMLTKKQLSDMAWGVRELSRRLSSMRIRFRVKTIFILTKVYDQDLIPKTRELTRWLLDKDRPVPFVVYVQDKLRTNHKFDAGRLLDGLAESHAQDGTGAETARHALERRLRYWNEDMCRSRPHTFDFVITLGGDGTVLYASWLFQRIVPPVISFALGSLGFLTKFDFDDFVPTLNSAFDRGVTVSLRLRFESTVMRSIRRKGSDDGKAEDEAHGPRDLVEELVGEERENAHTHRPDGTYEILNEVVVDRGPNASECPYRPGLRGPR